MLSVEVKSFMGVSIEATSFKGVSVEVNSFKAVSKDAGEIACVGSDRPAQPFGIPYRALIYVVLHYPYLQETT